MNRGQLYTALGQYLENAETTFMANRDLFVRLAEEDIYRQVQLPALRRNSTSYFVIGNPYLSMPGDFLSAYTLAVIYGGEHRYMLSKEVNFIREAFPDAAEQGVPRFFSYFDNDTFLIGPTPDQAYEVEMHYFHRPQSISTLTDGQTNWLLTNAENAILFGTLYHGYVYMKGDQDMVNHYKSQLDKAIGDLKVIAEGRSRKDSFRNIDARMPV